MEIEELIFGNNLRKRICLLLLQVFSIFCNKNWTAAATFFWTKLSTCTLSVFRCVLPNQNEN